MIWTQFVHFAILIDITSRSRCRCTLSWLWTTDKCKFLPRTANIYEIESKSWLFFHFSSILLIWTCNKLQRKSYVASTKANIPQKLTNKITLKIQTGSDSKIMWLAAVDRKISFKYFIFASFFIRFSLYSLYITANFTFFKCWKFGAFVFQKRLG